MNLRPQHARGNGLGKPNPRIFTCFWAPSRNGAPPVRALGVRIHVFSRRFIGLGSHDHGLKETMYSDIKIDTYRGMCVIPCSEWGKLNTNTPTAVGIDFSMLKRNAKFNIF